MPSALLCAAAAALTLVVGRQPSCIMRLPGLAGMLPQLLRRLLARSSAACC
jgi:hypothetical protein